MATPGASTINGGAKSPSQGVEMSNMENGKPPLPVEEDLMQLARLGEIGAIQKLFDGGKFDATYTDEQGITALHVWDSLAVDTTLDDKLTSDLCP